MTKTFSLSFIAMLFVVSSVLTGCSKVPDTVIPPDKMADLLTDTYIADAVVENDYAGYGNDSSRLALRQAVLDKYGVTSEKLDTSLGWYGRHLEIYNDVQDKVMENLERRLADVSGVISAAGVSVQGDSVDVWTHSPFIRLRAGNTPEFLTFNIGKDENWQNGDSYTWRGKFVNLPSAASWQMGVLYSDGSIEYENVEIAADGWQHAVLMTDSTKEARAVYGTLKLQPKADAVVWIDSLQLIRKRYNPSASYNYRQSSARAARIPERKTTAG